MREEPREERAPVKGGWIWVLAACAAAGACSGPAPAHGSAGKAPPAPTAYVAPPAVTDARRTGASVLLSGTASAGAAIRLASPDGSALTGMADRKGAWRLTAPAGATPRLYSLSELSAGRLVRAIGYVAVLPAPGPAAAMLRPAASALVPGRAGARGLASVDYDASGAAVASGRSAPGETVRLALDGQEAGADRADAAGGFSASLAHPLAPGQHVLSVSARRFAASAAFAATRSSQVATPPFDAQRLDGAWRIDWMAPGGGVQSTVLFDPRGGRS